MAKANITTPKGLAMYVSVFEPRSFEEGDTAKYQLVIAFPKDERRATAELPATDVSEMLKVGKEVRDEAFGSDGKSVRGDKFFLRDGDKGDNENLHGYYFIRPKSTYKPSVVGEKKAPNGKFPELLDDDDFYSGCYCRVTIGVFSTTKGGKCVAAGLNGVQRWGKGERLAGVDVNTAFDDLDGVDVEEPATTTAADEDDLLG